VVGGAIAQLTTISDIYVYSFAQFILTRGGVVCILLHVEQNSKKIIKRLEKDGWMLRNVSGSHHQFIKGSKRVTVPHPKKDLPTGTARQIAKAAGWI